jgi:antitoxin component YwqK of YwqJK toxin-antitoxin module
MIRNFAPIFVLVLLFPSLAMSDTVDWDDLVKFPPDGLYYKKFTDVPFTGEVTGQRQGQFKDGRRDGAWVEYYQNGLLAAKGDYKDGEKEGPWVTYHQNGQLSGKGDFKNGVWDGPWVWYYYNDQLYMRGDFKGGEWDGPWVGYWMDGTKADFSGTYRNGVKVPDYGVNPIKGMK